MMKEYWALAYDKYADGKKWEIIKSEYPTKKAFREDLNANGYAVRFIATEETWDEESEKWGERNERNKAIQKYIRMSDDQKKIEWEKHRAEQEKWKEIAKECEERLARCNGEMTEELNYQSV